MATCDPWSSARCGTSSRVASQNLGTSSHNRYSHCTTPTPSRVTLTRRHHPLQGHTFEVLQTGARQLVVRALDGVSMRLPRAWTDADGASPGNPDSEAVFSVEAIRTLLEMVEALRRRGVVDARVGSGACHGPEGGTRCPSSRVSTCGESASTPSGDDSRSDLVEPSSSSTRV